MAPFAGTSAPEAVLELDDEAALEDEAVLEAVEDEAALDAAEDVTLEAAEDDALLEDELDAALDDEVPSEPPPPPPHAARMDANRTAGTRPALTGDAMFESPSLLLVLVRYSQTDRIRPDISRLCDR